jgi:adenosylcobinamide amidohydrolase
MTALGETSGAMADVTGETSGAMPALPALPTLIAGWPTLEDEGRLLVVRFPTVQRTLSWAVTGGGFARTRAVVWRHVPDGELGPDDDPAALLRRALAAAGLDGAVGLLTARALARFDCVTRQAGGEAARAVATVGLGNALAAGDPPGPLRVGTINVLVQLSHPLNDGAFAEALALAAEARTAAVLEARVPSRRSQQWATGTGTDCLVIAAPDSDGTTPPRRYVGKHTQAGSLVGQVVREAVARGVRRWIGEQAARDARASGGAR